MMLQAVFAVLMLAMTSRAQNATTIGTSYLLSGNDIYSPHLGGTTMFEAFHPDCYREEVQHVTTDDRSSYTDTSSFYHSIASDSKLSVSLTGAYTMGMTLNVKTKAMSSGQTEIRGTSLDVRTYVKVKYLDENCFKTENSRLKQDVVNMFDSLPSTIDKPWLSESWSRYQTFLNTYGSHFVTKTFLGAIVRQWTFSKAESKYSDNQLRIRACVDFTGTTEVGKLNISACSGVSKEDAEASKHLECSNYMDVRGGSDAARNKFLSTRNQEDLNRVLAEGRQMQSPVSYEYEAVWDILQMKFYNDSGRYAKALNLMHYYHGFLDFGCTRLTNAQFTLRQFQYTEDTTDDVPMFHCLLINQGCHSDSDCHIGGAGTVTYCYGNSCFEYQSPAPGKKAKTVVVRQSGHDHYYVGVNKSCHYKSPFKARCIEDYYPEEIIWSGEHSTTSAMRARSRARANVPILPNAAQQQQKIEL